MSDKAYKVKFYDDERFKGKYDWFRISSKPLFDLTKDWEITEILANHNAFYTSPDGDDSDFIKIYREDLIEIIRDTIFMFEHSRKVFYELFSECEIDGAVTLFVI